MRSGTRSGAPRHRARSGDEATGSGPRGVTDLEGASEVPGPARAPRSGLAPVVVLVLEALLLVLVVAGVTDDLLPAGVATRVAHNSETLALALVLSGVLLGARAARRPPRSWSRARVRRTGAVVGVLVLLLGVGLLAVEAPRLRTLNEPFIAAGLLTLYCLPARPARGIWWAGPGLLVVVLLVLAAPGEAPLVRDQAEAITALVLAPIGLDLVSPRSVDPVAPEHRRRTWAWIAVLVLVPLVLVAVPGDVAVVEELSRGNESFWGLALVHLALLVDAARPRRPRETQSSLLGNSPIPGTAGAAGERA